MYSSKIIVLEREQEIATYDLSWKWIYKKNHRCKIEKELLLNLEQENRAHSDSITPQIIVRNESKLEGNSKGKDEAKKT